MSVGIKGFKVLHLAIETEPVQGLVTLCLMQVIYCKNVKIED